MGIVLTIVASTLPCRSAPDEELNSLSEFTKQLIGLMGLWGRLNQATADRVKGNERYLLAKAMPRLSSDFYALKIAKEGFVASIEAIPADGTIDLSVFIPAVNKLDVAIQCFSEQLTNQGAGLGMRRQR
jgi:hypothetical protein